MLTYASIEDFKRAKFDQSVPANIPVDRKLADYLMRATRFIRKHTRRDFHPWRETRSYPVPHKFLDLQMRRFPTANLYMDQDLLEIYTITNGNGDELTFSEDYFLLEPNIWPKFAVSIKFPNYWGGPFSSALFSRHFDEPVITVDGVWGYHDGYNRDEAWIDTFEVVPSGGLTASQKKFTLSNVDDTDGMYLPRIERGYLLKINDEFMEVVNVDTTTNQVTVLRGQRGTTATTHDEDDPIYRWRVHEEIVDACIKIAKIWREADQAAGGRLGVSDISSGVEVSIPADPLKTLNGYVRSIVG